MDAELRAPGFWESLRELLPGRRRMLDSVQVEVTSRCLGRCFYCPHTIYKKSWQSRDMPLERFRRLWPILLRAERVHLQGWGEPLLNPALFGMAKLARKAGCAVSTTTCGLGLTEERAVALVESEFDLVAFSLMGTDEPSNAGRDGIAFRDVTAAVNRLQAVRRARGAVHMEIHFAYLMLASHMTAVRGLPVLMQRLGVHAAVVSMLNDLPDAGLADEAFLPAETDKLAAAQAILAETAAEARRLGMGFDYFVPQSDHARPGCREGLGRSVFVSAGGDLSPCVFLNIPAGVLEEQRRIFGNIDSEDPLTIWEKPAYRAFRAIIGFVAGDAVCRTCPKRFMDVL